MNARLLKAAKVRELVGKIQDNLEAYRKGNFDFLRDDPSLYLETQHEILEDRLAEVSCTESDHREVQNCISVFEAMGNLSHYLARDERLWVYLVHTNLLEYSRQRWPIPDDDEKAIQHIRNHFFVIGARGFERDNAASRLWWMASLCSRVKDLTLEESLTSLLYQYDVRANIIERPTTSQTIGIFSAIIKKLHESYKGDKSLFERDKFRKMMKELNLTGGIKLLSAMDENEVTAVVEKLT